MNDKEFEERVLYVATHKIRQVLGAKAAEYAKGGDRLSNFKRAAAALYVTPERALMGMVAKHDVSVLDMIDDIDRGTVAPLEVWEEKLFDAINYRILLYGLVLERLLGAGEQAPFTPVGMADAEGQACLRERVEKMKGGEKPRAFSALKERLLTSPEVEHIIFTKTFGEYLAERCKKFGSLMQVPGMHICHMCPVNVNNCAIFQAAEQSYLQGGPGLVDAEEKR